MGKAGSLLLSTLFFLVLVEIIQDEKKYPSKLYIPITGNPQSAAPPCTKLGERHEHFCNDQHIFQGSFHGSRIKMFGQMWKSPLRTAEEKALMGSFGLFFKTLIKALKVHSKCKVLVDCSFWRLRRVAKHRNVDEIYSFILKLKFSSRSLLEILECVVPLN